jgi:hypothetical protein
MNLSLCLFYSRHIPIEEAAYAGEMADWRSMPGSELSAIDGL